MLLGFSSCCPALKIMLCGFKICCPDLYLSVRATLGIVIFFCLDWRYNEDCTLPDSIGCRFLPNSYNAKAALCGCTEPLVIGETLDSLLGLQVLRPSQPLQDLLGAQRPYLSPPLSHKVTFAGKNQRLSDRIKHKKHQELLSPSSFRDINIWNFSLLPV